MLALVLAALVTAVPATVHENMIFVEARVNGGAPGTFLVDTAAPRSFADPRLGVKADSEAELDIGGLQTKVPSLGALDLGFFSVTEDLQLDGVLGMDVLRQFAVELDFDAALVRFLPAGYEGAGEVIPVRIEKNKPYLRAKLKMPGKPAVMDDYLLDSGSGGAIVDERFPGLGRAEYITIGSFRFAGANGTNGERKIGGELLKRFNVIADFARSRIILEPNRHFRDALLFDTSGLELENHEAGLKIAQVYPRTPAAEAGLAAGDIIKTIDAQPARVLGLDRVRKMFHQVRTHTLTVLRGGKELTITLKLRTLIPTVAAGDAKIMQLFPVRIAGGAEPYWFLVDTGSSYNFIDASVAARLRLQTRAAANVRGAGGAAVEVRAADGVTFELGEMRATFDDVRLTDLSGLEPLFQHRVDGFFGYPLLERFVVTIDPRKQHIVLNDPAPKGAVLPIRFGGKTNRWIYVQASVKYAGNPPETSEFLVDSGSQDGVDHPAIRKSKGPLHEIRPGNGLGAGGGGAGVAGRAEWFRLGPFELKDVASSCCGPLEGTERMIGSAVLSRFVVTYDYARRRMIISAISPSRS